MFEYLQKGWSGLTQALARHLLESGVLKRCPACDGRGSKEYHTWTGTAVGSYLEPCPLLTAGVGIYPLLKLVDGRGLGKQHLVPAEVEAEPMPRGLTPGEIYVPVASQKRPRRWTGSGYSAD